MTGLDHLTLRTDGLSARAAFDAGVVRLAFEGSAGTSAEVELSQLLGRVHGESLRTGVREVAVDVRALDSLNSTCFKCFLTWIEAVRQSAAELRYRIRFVANPGLRWQQRSLHALTYFGGDLVSIDGQAR